MTFETQLLCSAAAAFLHQSVCQGLTTALSGRRAGRPQPLGKEHGRKCQEEENRPEVNPKGLPTKPSVIPVKASNTPRIRRGASLSSLHCAQSWKTTHIRKTPTTPAHG